MRKIIYIIGVLMFMSAVTRPWLGHADATNTTPQDQSCNVFTDPNCRVSARIEYALQSKGNEGLDWGNSFGTTDPKKVGQNLYMMIYSQSQANPMSDAIKATAAQYGMPPERMSLILAGDISPILQSAPLMSIANATNIYNRMVATYNDKKDSSQLNATIQTTVMPNEIFEDGDVDNSGGFDLINDLNNIEIILFKKNDLVTFGQAYSGSSGDNGSNGSGGGNQTSGGIPQVPTKIGGPTEGAGVSGGQSGGGGAAASPKMQNPFTVADQPKNPAMATGINPNQCFSTQNIDKALDDFVAAGAKDSRLKSTFDPTKIQTNSTATGSGTGNSGANSGGTGPNIGVSGGTPSTSPTLAPAPPADYSGPSLCGDVICLTIDFVKKPATPAFDKTDNCIDCHIQYINDAIQKTISHSLIPAKASGNLGESGLCKNAAAAALGSVGMNVTLQLVPIVTPPKNDLMTVGNITDEWDKYASKYGGWNYDTKHNQAADAKKNGTPVDYTPLPSDSERIVQLEVQKASDTTTISDVMAKAADTYNTQQAQQAQQQLEFQVANNAYGDVDTLKALDDQMQQMNQFFDGFKKQFTTLLQDVPGLSALKPVKNYPVFPFVHEDTKNKQVLDDGIADAGCYHGRVGADGP